MHWRHVYMWKVKRCQDRPIVFCLLNLRFRLIQGLQTSGIPARLHDIAASDLDSITYDDSLESGDSRQDT